MWRVGYVQKCGILTKARTFLNDLKILRGNGYYVCKNITVGHGVGLWLCLSQQGFKHYFTDALYFLYSSDICLCMTLKNLGLSLPPCLTLFPLVLVTPALQTHLNSQVPTYFIQFSAAIRASNESVLKCVYCFMTLTLIKQKKWRLLPGQLCPLTWSQ